MTYQHKNGEKTPLVFVGAAGGGATDQRTHFERSRSSSQEATL